MIYTKRQTSHIQITESDGKNEERERRRESATDKADNE